MKRVVLAGIGAVAFAASAAAQNAPVSLTNQLETASSNLSAVTPTGTSGVAPNILAPLAAAVSAPIAAAGAVVQPVAPAAAAQPVVTGRSGTNLDAAVARHAALNGLPESLVHRVIKRESGYRPGVVSKGNYGLMQIKPATARGVGYTGSAAGLLDAETNLTYAVRYLAGAYRVAGGNHDRAVRLYASGYYYEAKRQGLTRTSRRVHTAVAQ
jgi:soluble lytic murein transglycosylase-like protein